VVKGGGSLPSDQKIHSQDNIHDLPVFRDFWARFSVLLCVRCRSSSGFPAWSGFLVLPATGYDQGVLSFEPVAS